MAKMEFDAVDAALVVAGLASAFMLVGIASFQLFDVDFTATQFTLGGIGLSTAWILGYASIVGVIITNDNTDFQSLSDDIQGLQGWYMAAAVGTLVLPVAFVALPDTVGSFFQSSDLWGLLYVIAVTTGQFALGWML
ncbi:hypothetical protein PM030_08125 [Halorubrum ezzemoulense]|uniref:hypothetical protein n=1 Tax=Halorubrum ezzemoulense TaxID=337243 RepID=UPI00232FAE00|nr:hypothetical protein [Halorubrum ezzemoulense]MDB2281841.1 hypothetical protein [Halorubrum ezzemoulense]MDB9235353.1 hypothetical protein [Halorubrum ezzemoulense]